MYNLNNAGLTPNPPVSKPTDNTPQTPEILNLISCTNPFDNYPPFQTSTGGKLVEKGSNGGSSPPQSVQHTCSQIIKEGLKLALQTKRRSSYSSCSDSYYAVGGALTKDLTEMSRDSVEDEDDDDQSSCISNGEGLTVEDEERRRRRRERNKIAATKCRLKKRERTVNLVHESEILETQNHDLKSQIQELESQRRRLVDMLSVHKPCCTKKDGVQFSMEPVSIPFIQPFQTSGSHSSSVHSSLSGGSAHSNSLSNVHSSTSGSILSSGSVTSSSVHSSSNLSSGSLHSITSGSLHSSSNMTSSLHSSSNMSSGSLHSTSNMSSGNVHDSSNRDRMTQKDQTLSFPTTDSMHLYDDSDLSTGQCSGSNLHDLDSTYDMSGEVKDIMLPFCASTEALSLGLHYDDEFINNYDPSLWHRPDSVTYRTSFQETYRACANNNNLVSHSKTKDGRAVSKQCADDHEGLLNE